MQAPPAQAAGQLTPQRQREMSKCCLVLCSPQEIEGFKCLDCQWALFSDYNFVFTSFAKQQQQQS